METIPTFKFTKKQIRDYEKNLRLLSKRDNDPFKFEFDRIKSKETFVMKLDSIVEEINKPFAGFMDFAISCIREIIQKSEGIQDMYSGVNMSIVGYFVNCEKAIVLHLTRYDNRIFKYIKDYKIDLVKFYQIYKCRNFKNVVKMIENCCTDICYIEPDWTGYNEHCSDSLGKGW